MSKRNPDISFFISTMGDGGAQRTIANLVRGFDEKNYCIDLLLINKTGPYLQSLPDSVNIIQLSTNRALTSIFPLIRYLRSAEPAVFISSMEYLNVVSIISSYFAKQSTDIAIRAVNIRTERSEKTIQEFAQTFLARLLYPHADHLIAISESVCNDLVNHYNLNKNKVSIIYNPVLVSEIQNKSHEKLDLDNIDSTSDIILSVGSLTEQKDMTTTVRSFARLVEDRDAELIILGKGEKKKEVIQLSEDLNINDSVHLLGFVDNPFKYMNASDVFVLSSKWEGFGHVIVEAMACGTPVVSTDCPGGPSEILNGGEYGELVPVGDDKALAAAIEQTLQNPLNEETLVGRAMDFHYQHIVDQYEYLLFSKEHNPASSETCKKYS